MKTEFGDYLKEKRKSRHYTVKILASLIGKSISYVSQLESGIRPAPKKETLETISDSLVLNKGEKEKLFDLAAKSRNALSDDLTEYINSHEEVKKAIRFSKGNDIPEDEWHQFYNQLKDKFFI